MNLNRTELCLNGALSRLKTIGQLIEAGELTSAKEGALENEHYIFNTIYGDAATITVANYFKKGYGTPLHCHPVSKEFIICVLGTFKINFDGGYRIVNPGDCVSLDKGTMHGATLLTESGRLLGICIPCDEDYQRSMASCPEKL